MRLKRIISIAMTPPIAIALGLLTSASVSRAAIDLNPVTIDCGDGYPIHANLTLTELTRVQGIIQAMISDPLGSPACTLTQGGTGVEDDPFIFGSGTYGSIVNCELRFHVKASTDETGAAHGFQFVKAPEDNCGTAPPPAGELRANVTCVAVLNNVGEMRGIVRESSGLFSEPIIDIHPGDVMFTQAQENAQPVPDQINQFKDPPGTQNSCVAQIDQTQAFPLDSGDLEVHSGS